MGMIIFLILLAFLLAAAEVIVPGGIFALLAFVALIGAGLATYLDYGIWLALAVFFAGFILNICLVYLLFRLLGKTSLRGKFVLGSRIDGHTSGEPDDDSLIGLEGIALTAMAPTGQIDLDGVSHEGLSRSGMISKGSRVRVVARDSFRLVVEKVSL